MKFSRFNLSSSILLIFLSISICFSYSMTILPLQLQTAKSIMASTQPNKLLFQHDVALTVSLTVGSPPQKVTMVLDTGSELSWLHCKRTTSTPVYFNSVISSSYLPVNCSSPICKTKTRDLILPVSCDAGNLCHVILSYADSSSVEGNLATEIFRISGSDVPRGLIFGCMDSSSTSNPEDSKTTGIIGMNRGSLSLVSQMGFSQFSYCIAGGHGSSGVLLFGETNLPWLSPLQYTPLVKISTPLPYFDRIAYTVQLTGIRVSNTILPLPKSIYEPDHTGAGQTMVDSGTQFTFLLGPVYTSLRNEFARQTRDILRPFEEHSFVFQGAMDLCYRIETNKAIPPLPAVSLMFQGAEMSVNGEKLLYKVPDMIRGNDWIHCFTFGNSDLLGIEAFVIGHHHQQNMWMEFDLAKSRVGLTEFKCDIANQRLGLSSP